MRILALKSRLACFWKVRPHSRFNQMPFEKCHGARDRGLRLGGIGHDVLEHVGHAFVQVEHGFMLASSDRLIVAHEVAEEDLARAALDEGRRKRLHVVSVDRADIGVPLVGGIGVGGGAPRR